jgi:hypothetical protein
MFVALILAHIYIVTIGMEGAFEAMGTGKVDLNWAKEHHDLWLAQQLANEDRWGQPSAPAAERTSARQLASVQPARYLTRHHGAGGYWAPLPDGVTSTVKGDLLDSHQFGRRAGVRPPINCRKN